MKPSSTGWVLVGSFALFVACSGTSTGSTSSSGTSGGSVPCKQKADADTAADCANEPGKPRKLDCDTADTQTAVAAGCTPIPSSKAGEASSDVCCPTTVTGVASGTSSSGTSGSTSGSSGTSGTSGTSGSSGTSGTSGSSGTSGGGDAGSCATTFGGTYAMTGTCAETSCTVVQTGCNLSVSCTGGTTMTGMAVGTTATLKGTFQGVSITCSTKATSATTFDLDCAVCTSKGTKTSN